MKTQLTGTIGSSVIFYDETEGALTSLWRLGAGGQKFLGNFDFVVPVKSWIDVYEFFRNLPAKVWFNNIQIWGHGRHGTPLVAGKSCDLKMLRAATLGRIGYDADVWFRSCDVFSGVQGIRFAIMAALELNCRVTGHTRIVSWPIPLYQSGGYTLEPGRNPQWDIHEGITDEGKSMGSYPWAGNTCTIFTMRPPKAWRR